MVTYADLFQYSLVIIGIITLCFLNYVTYSDLIQFGILIVVIIALCKTGR